MTRPLTIRHLKTAYGDFLDLEHRVVGDFFDDRGTDGNIRNSILEVHRYPPKPNELEILQRYSSLAPNSSARPPKRPLELPSHPYPSEASQNIHGAIPSIEQSDSEIDTPYQAGTKRRRTREPVLSQNFGASQRSMTREGRGAELYLSSQTSGTQESIHQVVDSQKSLEKNRTFYLSHLFIIILIYLVVSNPYGTPTSLLFISSQDSIPSTDIDPSAIPDSPLGRGTTAGGGAFEGAVQLDRESNTSESPELDTSVRDVPLTDPNNTSGEQPITSADRPELSTTSGRSKAPLQAVSIAQIVDRYAKDHGLGVRQTHEKAADVDHTPMRTPLTADPAHAQFARSYSNTLCEPDPVFDPIESDTESFLEKQCMQSAKRLRSSKTPTQSYKPFRTSGGVEIDRRDGLFLVPSVPPSRTNVDSNSTRGLNGSVQRENIQTPRQDPRVSTSSVHSDPKRHREYDAECMKDPQSKRSMRHGLMDAFQTSSQASTIWSQDSNESASGTAQSAVQQTDNAMLRQNKEHDKTTHSSHNERTAMSNLDGGPSGRLTQETHEQQEKKAGRDLIKEQTATHKEAREKGKILADKKLARDQQTQAQELAQAKKETIKKGELAEAKRKEETIVKEAILQMKNTQELARERRTREMLLAEEAKKLMLTAAGAKKIEAEEIEKTKARREELAAMKKANESKAEEQAKEARAKTLAKKAREEQPAPANAQKLADIEFKDAKDRGPQVVYKVQTPRETATAVIVKTQKKIADENLQKLRLSQEAQSRIPRNSSSVTDLRSMTPHVPSSSVNKSASHSISLASSPLNRRSSGNVVAPLRSVLRQTPSTLRQSMSSVTFDLPPQDELNKPDNRISSTPRSQSLAENEKESASKSSSKTNLEESRPKALSNTPARTPLKTPIPQKAAVSKNAKTPAKNGKVQTKLNVTRVPKKLKGRAVQIPITPRPAPRREIILSSGSESTDSEEPEWQTGNAVAGPSSRKPVFAAATSAETKSLAAVAPQIGSIKVENRKIATPAALPRSNPKLKPASLQMSKSRSPALALPETISVSSGCASTTSDSEMESDSEGEFRAPSSKMPTGAKERKLTPITLNGINKPANMVVDQSKDPSMSKAASPLNSQASLSRSRGTISMQGDGEQVDQAADRQLQLESRRSIPSSRTCQASAATNSSTDKKIINQGLDHAGCLPNGIRPAYYKYPPLSELQKLPRPATPEVGPNKDTSSRPLDVLPVERSGSDESSSESDEGSGDSDEDEDVDAPPGQTWSEQKSRPYPGMKECIKCRLRLLQ